jgi:hypothetical protein
MRGQTCSACEPGKIQPLGSQTSCNACPTGYFQPEFQKTSCLMCGPGNGSTAAGDSQCSVCTPGTYQSVSAGLYPCPSCENGKTQTLAGQTSCYSCGPGYWTPPGNSTCSPTPCKTCSPGNFVQTSTACYTGFTQQDQTCTTCPALSCQLNERVINSCPGNGSINLQACVFKPVENSGINCNVGNQMATTVSPILVEGKFVFLYAVYTCDFLF